MPDASPTARQSDLARHIASLPLCDTHEHLRKEVEYVEQGPDILQDLFANYVTADLVVAGASSSAMRRLTDASDPDVADRFRGIQDAWEAVKHTGYGEAVRLIARTAYDLEELSADGIAAAALRAVENRRPGERLKILRERGGLDHVQVDDFVWACAPDASGPGFFLYDLSWAGFCNGTLDAQAVFNESGIEVSDLATLDEAMAALFAKYAPYAIAVKAQHAYNRTLLWQEREQTEVERALQATLSDAAAASESTRLCLGDWSWARGVELAMEHNLPFKIHTGYYAGHSRMPVDRIRAGNLCGLLTRYPRARFVLMHIAYPYNDELVALAKHYPNVWVDLCWAWSIDPFSACEFVRRMIHAVPINKLFAFGGDTAWPNAAVAYSIQARTWLTRALEAEVRDGLLTEADAIHSATRLMRVNQYECFDLARKRQFIRETLA